MARCCSALAGLARWDVLLLVILIGLLVVGTTSRRSS